jgi:hypothetical protein
MPNAEVMMRAQCTTQIRMTMTMTIIFQPSPPEEGHEEKQKACGLGKFQLMKLQSFYGMEVHRLRDDKGARE